MFLNTIAKADSTHTYYIHIQKDKYNEQSWLKINK